jgi:cysteine-rich repeat protein
MGGFDMRARTTASSAVLRSLGLVVLGALVILPSAALAQPAPDGKSVLILSSLDADGYYAGRVTALGMTAVSTTPLAWGARTTAQIATFKAIVVPDPTCGSTPPPTATTWTWAAIDGPILIIGTDENFHRAVGGGTLIDSGLKFVTSGGAKTGAYISLSCYYETAPSSTPVPLLAPLGAFTVEGSNCHNAAHIVAVHPALAASTDTTLSNWSCSTHNFFNSFPASFLPLAIAHEVTGLGQLNFADGTTGIPYILARGEGITPNLCGNGVINPPEECDDGNIFGNDGCSSTCKLEEIGVPDNKAIAKHVLNHTGQPANGFEWLVEGNYSSVPVLNYQSPASFSAFSKTLFSGNTLFRWEAVPPTATIAAGASADFAFRVAGPPPNTLKAAWTLNGVVTACIPQITLIDVPHFGCIGGCDFLYFRNTVNDPPICPDTDLYVGDISIEWLQTEAPLEDLNEFADRSPIRTDVVPGTHMIPAGFEVPLSTPLPPPADATFAMIKVSIADDPGLTDASTDYFQVAMSPLPPAVPAASRWGTVALVALITLLWAHVTIQRRQGQPKSVV